MRVKQWEVSMTLNFEYLLPEIEQTIDNLALDFQRVPAMILTEDDLKCHLFARLLQIPELSVAQPTICLLYTSPSPRDLSTSRMPSSA